VRIQAGVSICSTVNIATRWTCPMIRPSRCAT